MQLISTLLPLFFTSLTLAAPVNNKRSTATVLSDFSTISSDVATLTSDALSYTGNIFQSLALAITVNNLESAITGATSDTTSSAVFSAADSDSILAAVTTLTPKIVTLLSDLNAKAPVIATAGFTSTVESALKTLVSDTDALFAAVKAKVNAADAAALTPLQASIDAAFATSIAIY